MASLSMSLHAVNHRLTNIPVKQLPPLASCLATSLSNCGELLSSPQQQKSAKSDSDDAVQVHKLMTRLASLLQDRTPEGRWTAVVLVKTVVEAGQWEILRGCEPFVRGLMAILTKADPTSTKKMAVITLTRIFHLTYQYPTLVREITTPSLPGFVTSALNLISVKPSSEPIRTLKPNATPFLEIVLHAFGELIGRHPTIFRPFSAQIHSLLQTIIGSTSPTFPESVVALAERLFVLLHNCAPKNTSGEEWKNACHMTIASLHGTAHYVFRAVVEQWESTDPSMRKNAGPQDYTQEVCDLGPDPLGLPRWQGIGPGVDRLVVLLRMLSTFLNTPSASTVSIPIGSILDLTSRLTSVTVPANGVEVQTNPQIGRAERETLFAELPRIHTACFNLLVTFVKRLETGAVPVGQTMLEQALWVFRAEKYSREARAAIYDLTRALFMHMGPSLTKQSVSSLTNLIHTCCCDLLPPVGDESPSAKLSADMKAKTKTNQVMANADSFLNPGLKSGRQLSPSSSFPDLKRAASELIPALLANVPTEYLAPSLRAEIDRTIIMTSDKNGMFASVLNPVPPVKGRGMGASIIPFLARGYAAQMEVEGLIRPRMPVLTNASSGLGGYVHIDEDEEDEDDVTVPASAPHAAPVNTGFLKQSATPILQNDLMDIQETQPTVPSLNKRSHGEDQPQTLTTQSNAGKTGQANGQTKRPRVENEVVAAAPSQPSVTRVSPDTFTGTAAIPVPTSSATFTQAPPAQTASVNTSSKATAGGPLSGTTVSQPMASAAKAEAGDDESDDELPTLNMDPDTDDEEEEDVTMGES